MATAKIGKSRNKQNKLLNLNAKTATLAGGTNVRMKARKEMPTATQTLADKPTHGRTSL